MALSIKHPEAERLARELAAKTGESLTDAVIVALKERLKREQGKGGVPRLKDELLEIGKRCRELPDLDSRPADQILGYDESGLPE